MTHQVDEDVRRDTPKRGPAVVMAIGIIGALVLAVMFPFAVSTVQPKQLPPLERAIQRLNHENLLIDGDAGSKLDTSTLRLLKVDENGIGFLAGFTGEGAPVGVIIDKGMGATVGTGEPGSTVMGIGTGTPGAAYLQIEVAPAAELGFRFCTLSKTDDADIDNWLREASDSCESS